MATIGLLTALLMVSFQNCGSMSGSSPNQTSSSSASNSNSVSNQPSESSVPVTSQLIAGSWQTDCQLGAGLLGGAAIASYEFSNNGQFSYSHFSFSAANCAGLAQVSVSNSGSYSLDQNGNMTLSSLPQSQIVVSNALVASQFSSKALCGVSNWPVSSTVLLADTSSCMATIQPFQGTVAATYGSASLKLGSNLLLNYQNSNSQNASSCVPPAGRLSLCLPGPFVTTSGSGASIIQTTASLSSVNFDSIQDLFMITMTGTSAQVYSLDPLGHLASTATGSLVPSLSATGLNGTVYSFNNTTCEIQKVASGTTTVVAGSGVCGAGAVSGPPLGQNLGTATAMAYGNGYLMMLFSNGVFAMQAP